MQLVPGQNIGPFKLGRSFSSILQIIQSASDRWGPADVTYDANDPLRIPIVVALPFSGLRLRFDGPSQCLRLIEVLDFAVAKLQYNNHNVWKDAGDEKKSISGGSGPSYRTASKLFGPTFPGELIPPEKRNGRAISQHILSYPGLAISFRLKIDTNIAQGNQLPLPMADTSATSLSIFNGRSWPDVRNSLFPAEQPSRFSARPRTASSESATETSEHTVLARIFGEGRIDLVHGKKTMSIILSETTPQDLVSDLGPPDAIYRKSDRRLSIHRTQRPSGSHKIAQRDIKSMIREDSFEVDDGGEDGLEDEDADADANVDPAVSLDDREILASEHFYNYYHLGLDILISQPSQPSAPSPSMPEARTFEPMDSAFLPKNHLTATKILIHGNVPGAWNFGRYGRCRWSLEHIPTARATQPLLSETQFDTVTRRLDEVFSGDSYDATGQRRGMTLDRGSGASPDSSCELLGGWEEQTKSPNDTQRSKGAEGLGHNTSELFGYPGLIFETLANGAINCLTVY